MGKKQRRKHNTPRTGVEASIPAPAPPLTQSPISPEPRTAAAVPPPVARNRPGTSWTDISERYQHVNAELKQIGILAGSFLVVLLVLTVILG